MFCFFNNILEYVLPIYSAKTVLIFLWCTTKDKHDLRHHLHLLIHHYHRSYCSMVGYDWDTKSKPSLIAGKWSIPKFIHFISSAFFP